MQTLEQTSQKTTEASKWTTAQRRKPEESVCLRIVLQKGRETGSSGHRALKIHEYIYIYIYIYIMIYTFLDYYFLYGYCNFAHLAYLIRNAFVVLRHYDWDRFQVLQSKCTGINIHSFGIKIDSQNSEIHSQRSNLINLNLGMYLPQKRRLVPNMTPK